MIRALKMMARQTIAVLGIAVAVAVLVASPAMAEGPTVLTLAGKLKQANRGPVDPFADIFLDFHDIAFDRAYTFDVETLAGLGMHRLTTTYPGSDRTLTVEGPLLRDVLSKAGATGSVVTVMAVDGYAAEIPVSDLETWPVVLALKSDGEWLGLGGRGPAWVVYPVSDYPALAGTDVAKWVWGAFFMRVE